MWRKHEQLVWILAACAVVAQIGPKASCRACDQGCCADQARTAGPASTEAGGEPSGSCPRCAASAGHRSSETTDRPCRCQLHARRDQPLSVSRNTLLTFAAAGPTIGLAVTPPLAPRVLGISREHVAASLAVPIRPPRILFGVWRN